MKPPHFLPSEEFSIPSPSVSCLNQNSWQRTEYATAYFSGFAFLLCSLLSLDPFVKQSLELESLCARGAFAFSVLV